MTPLLAHSQERIGTTIENERRTNPSLLTATLIKHFFTIQRPFRVGHWNWEHQHKSEEKSLLFDQIDFI